MVDLSLSALTSKRRHPLLSIDPICSIKFRSRPSAEVVSVATAAPVDLAQACAGAGWCSFFWLGTLRRARCGVYVSACHCALRLHNTRARGDFAGSDVSKNTLTKAASTSTATGTRIALRYCSLGCSALVGWRNLEPARCLAHASSTWHHSMVR